MTTESNTEKAAVLARDLKSDLSLIFNTLTAHTEAVERDLDLESANIRDLIEIQNESVQKQLTALTGSLQDLHRTLSSVRSDLSQALARATELEVELPHNPALITEEKAAEESEQGYSVDMSPREASHQRHDEPISVGSVLRSLLMANEPQQRERRHADHD